MYCGECLPASSDHKSGGTTWKLCNLVVVKLRRADRAYSLHSKASDPVWPGNLGYGSAWFETTKNFTNFRAVSPTVPGQGIWFISLLIRIYPSACLTRENLSRAHSKLHSPFSSECIVALEQSVQTVASPICRATVVVSPDWGIQWTPIWAPKQ